MNKVEKTEELSELEEWKREFTKLNEKLGEDVWGARLEADGLGGQRIRIFISYAVYEDIILEETEGVLAGYPLVFTVYDRDDYRKFYEGEQNENHDNDTKSEANHVTT